MNSNTTDKTTRMPKEIKLNSCDHFQLLFDYKIKKEKGTANTSQLLLELADPISLEELQQYLLSNPYFKSLINTTLIRPFWGKERFRFEQGKELEINELKMQSIVPSRVYQNDNVGSDPVKVSLIQLADSSAVLFQFNHIFIDNNGVKNLLRSFHGAQFEFHRTSEPKQNSFLKRMKSTLSLSRKMMYKWYESKAFIHSSSNEPVYKDYIIHTFSDEQTALIKSKINPSHRIASISSVLMSACCLSLQKLLIDRNEKPREFVFQQPFVTSSKKDPAHILGNRFSFIYYRLKPKQVTSLPEIETELNKQTMQQIRDRIPYKFLELESVLRWVNLRFHLWMISLPARGKLTSFAYSFVDETKVIDRFADREISNIVNIPPVMRKPPVTFGFVYYESRLRIQICFDKNTVKADEARLLFEAIKNQLLDQK